MKKKDLNKLLINIKDRIYITSKGKTFYFLKSDWDNLNKYKSEHYEKKRN